MKALAQHTAGDADGALKSVQDLAENYPDNANVQVLGGTVLQAQGRSEEAVGLLSKHQGSLEAYVVPCPCSSFYVQGCLGDWGWGRVSEGCMLIVIIGLR